MQTYWVPATLTNSPTPSKKAGCFFTHDDDGYLWRGVLDTATQAKAEEIEAEIRAQVERAISRGIRPSHIESCRISELLRVQLR